MTFQSTIEEFAAANKSRPKLLQENASLRAEKASLTTRLSMAESQLKESTEKNRNYSEEINRMSLLIESKYKPLEREFGLFKEDMKNQIMHLKKDREVTQVKLGDRVK